VPRSKRDTHAEKGDSRCNRPLLLLISAPVARSFDCLTQRLLPLLRSVQVDPAIKSYSDFSVLNARRRSKVTFTMFRNCLVVYPRHASQRLPHKLKPLLLARHFAQQPVLRAVNHETPQRTEATSSKPKQDHPDSGSSLLETIRAAPRPVKIVVILAFCVLSTAETIFWVQVGYRKFFGGGEKDAQEMNAVQDR